MGFHQALCQSGGLDAGVNFWLLIAGHRPSISDMLGGLASPCDKKAAMRCQFHDKSFLLIFLG